MSKLIAKISIVLCIITMFYLPVYATNWKSVGINRSGAHTYLDLDSIEKIDENTAIFWLRGIDAKKGVIGYIHTMLNKETNEYTMTKLSLYNLNGQLMGMFNLSEISEMSKTNPNPRKKPFNNKYKASNNDRETQQIKKLIWPNY